MNSELNEHQIEGLVLLGNALGTLYLTDPASGDFDDLVRDWGAVRQADARSWPFVAECEADVSVMALRNGIVNDDQTDLTWEYRRLFTGPGRRFAPPYGSVYLDRECVIFGSSTYALRAWMREHGVRRISNGSDRHEPEDHIGLLLLLLAWTAQAKPELVKELLRLHLLPWASHYLKLLESDARMPTYAALAQLTEKSLSGIKDALDLKVEQPRFYR